MKKAWIAVASKLVTFSILGNIGVSAAAQGVGSVIESQGVTLSPPKTFLILLKSLTS